MKRRLRASLYVQLVMFVLIYRRLSSGLALIIRLQLVWTVWPLLRLTKVESDEELPLLRIDEIEVLLAGILRFGIVTRLRALV